MKKFIATSMIAALGGFGIVGLTATAASAAPSPGAVKVCTAVNAAISGNVGPTADAASKLAAAQAAETSTTGTFNTQLGNFVGSVFTYIAATDAGTLTPVITAQYNTDAGTFVTALTNWSTARTAEDAAEATSTVLALQNQTLAALKSQFSC